jgi:aldehyde:ferredoxin oxidoreductase
MQVITLDLLVQLVFSATGIEISKEAFGKIAQRTEIVERLFNVREGKTRADDMLPARLFEDPIPQGPYARKKLSREELEAMKDELYISMGWDLSGMPRKDMLEKLGLKELAKGI